MVKAYPWDVLKLIHDHPLAPEGRNRTTLPVEQRFKGGHTNHTTIWYFIGVLLIIVALTAFCAGVTAMLATAWMVWLACWGLCAVALGAVMALTGAIQWQEGQ